MRRSLTYRPASLLSATAPPFPPSWLELTLVEGKTARWRMTAAIGFPTLRLLRARIGNFLAGPKPGAWKELDSRERRQLMP
ncbi:MAG: hypothetical protein ACLSUW_01920 [Akkermansia sp.]